MYQNMFALVFASIIMIAASQQTDIVVKNSQLFVNGEEFIIKGINYSPSPIGQVNNTGYCSIRQTPYNEYLSACFDSDYFDGGPNPAGGQPTSWFSELWARDFPNIKAMGVNTLRLYNANPATLQATKTYTTIYPLPNGKDHTQFMSYAQTFDLKVIFPLYCDQDAFLNTPADEYRRLLRFQIDEIGNYPNLLMYQFCNELLLNQHGLYNNAALMLKYNNYADYIRRYSMQKWNRFVPLTVAFSDSEMTFNQLTRLYHVDIISLNAFRGYNFGNLFTGSGANSGFSYWTCAYDKPLLISEFAATFNGYASGLANYIIYNTLQNIPNGLIGSAYFEYSSEPDLQKFFGAYGPRVNVQGDSNSVQVNSFIADNMQPLLASVDLTSGEINGTGYNFNSDYYALLGRSQTSLEDSQDRCSGFQECPGTGLPSCSANGVCDRRSGTCSCNPNWTGADCSIPVCPDSCNGRGSCSQSVTPPECYCQPGFYGLSCESRTSDSVAAGQCPGGAGAAACANGNGICNTNSWTCACFPGWAGDDCSVTDLGNLGDGGVVETSTNDSVVQAPVTTGASSTKATSTKATSATSGQTSATAKAASQSTASTASTKMASNKATTTLSVSSATSTRATANANRATSSTSSVASRTSTTGARASSTLSTISTNRATTAGRASSTTSSISTNRATTLGAATSKSSTTASAKLASTSSSTSKKASMLAASTTGAA